MRRVDSQWWQALADRVTPSSAFEALEPEHLAWSAGIALALIVVRPLWLIARVAVTLVHELGHALTGIIAGRKFTGFRINVDMSGHALTKGKPRGFGLVATTWAGYPSPAIVGTALIMLALGGWAAPAISVCLAVLVFALIRVRSFLTAVVMLGAIAGTGALWWWGADLLQAQVLVGAGLVLLVGAWRHVGAVARSSDTGSDAAALARLTGVPRAVWLATFVLVLGALTWLVVSRALELIG